jgi:glutaredoxin 2
MTMSQPILWSFRRCPYAMRARLAIQSSGVAVHLREILLRDKPPEFIADSAKATVPVLKLPHGEVIEESLDVMRSKPRLTVTNTPAAMTMAKKMLFITAPSALIFLSGLINA